jgi:hypothetical protein
MTGRAKSATCCPTPTDIDLNDPAAVATAELLIAEIEVTRAALFERMSALRNGAGQ